jgi:hypothetical protein
MRSLGMVRREEANAVGSSARLMAVSGFLSRDARSSRSLEIRRSPKGPSMDKERGRAPRAPPGSAVWSRVGCEGLVSLFVAANSKRVVNDDRLAIDRRPRSRPFCSLLGCRCRGQVHIRFLLARSGRSVPRGMARLSSLSGGDRAGPQPHPRPAAVLTEFRWSARARAVAPPVRPRSQG